MPTEVRRIAPASRTDFHALHCDANGAGWCRCVAWWVPTWKGWDARTAEENRALRDALFDRGEWDGYLLYEDGAPAAWCQVGPRDRLPKLVAQYSLRADPRAFAVTCFVVAPDRRGRGLAARLLAGVVEDLRARGEAHRLEAFPRRGEALPPEDAWTGPERLFLDAGFRVVRDHPEWPVLALDLSGSEAASRDATGGGL